MTPTKRARGAEPWSPPRSWALAGLLLLSLAAGCGTPGPPLRKAEASEPLLQAQTQTPEAELLDIGIETFTSAPVTEDVAEDSGTTEQIRKAEGQFVPYHLRETLQQTGHFGAVVVTPLPTEAVDVRVRGEIAHSNGEKIWLDVTVEDAAGYRWFRKRYEARATPESYTGNKAGEKDAFQAAYNAIANDIVRYLEKISSPERARIRDIARLRFAEQFAPDAFSGYLGRDKAGRFTVLRLPAPEDAQFRRVLQVREREAMFLDALNGHYETLYQKMWPNYENWRKFNLTEITALREVKNSAFWQKVVGFGLIALAIALEVGDVKYTDTVTDVLVLAGTQVVINGFNVSEQTGMHRAALEELSDSFAKEAEPLRLDLEGKVVELKGSAEEQYVRWRRILRDLYYAETGFTPPPDPAATP
jgi:hypothetical protein